MRRLFKVESEDKHADGGAVDALRVDELGGVGEVAAIFVERIAEAEAEFKFGNEFEERHVKVAAQTRFKHKVERLGTQFCLLVGHEVVHRLHAGNDVGAEVVEALPAKLKVNGYANVTGFHVLRLFLARS